MEYPGFTVTPHRKTGTMTTFTAPQSSQYRPAQYRAPQYRAPQYSAPQAPATQYPLDSDQRSPLAINGLVAMVIALVIIVTLVVSGGDAAADSPAPVGEPSIDAIEVYIVQPGDTLWGIAVERAQPGDDVQSLVNVLSESAGSASLEVGQRIVIDHMELRR